MFWVNGKKLKYMFVLGVPKVLSEGVNKIFWKIIHRGIRLKIFWVKGKKPQGGGVQRLLPWLRGLNRIEFLFIKRKNCNGKQRRLDTDNFIWKNFLVKRIFRKIGFYFVRPYNPKNWLFSKTNYTLYIYRNDWYRSYTGLLHYTDPNLILLSVMDPEYVIVADPKAIKLLIRTLICNTVLIIWNHWLNESTFFRKP